MSDSSAGPASSRARARAGARSCALPGTEGGSLPRGPTLGGVPGKHVPAAGGLARLEALTAARDAAGLLALFREDGTVVRFAALRAHLELVGPKGLPPLTDPLVDDLDPRAHDILATAFGAGGDARLAARLSEALPSLEASSARLAAAAAVVDIADRTAVDAAHTASDCDALEGLGRPAPGIGADAVAGLARGRLEQGRMALARLGSDDQVADDVHLAACERLLGWDDDAAAHGLEDLARGASDPRVRDLASLYLERLRGR